MSRKAPLDSGFSLVELMIGVMVMGIMAVGTMTLMNNEMAAQKALETRLSITRLTYDLLSIVSNNKTCINAIGNNVPFGPAQFAAAATPPPGSTTPVRPTEGLQLTLTLPDGEIAKQGQLLNSYKLNVDDLKLVRASNQGVDALGNNFFVADFIGRFNPVSSNSGGPIAYDYRSIAKIFLSVDKATSKIVSCATTSPTPDPNTIAALCAAFGGNFNANKSTCALKGGGGGSSLSGGGGSSLSCGSHPNGSYWSTTTGRQTVICQCVGGVMLGNGC
jgi:prepilin-type N-terminal cleavage/methylation domain-containing protein